MILSNAVTFGDLKMYTTESKSTIRQRMLTLELQEQFGGHCESPDCRWHNDDGTIGCTDRRALQFDHVGGGGSTEPRGLTRLYLIRRDLKWAKPKERNYQLLCANCNWIKRHEAGEARGAAQHRQPARLRPALQEEGRPVRRVSGKSRK